MLKWGQGPAVTPGSRKPSAFTSLLSQPRAGFGHLLPTAAPQGLVPAGRMGPSTGRRPSTVPGRHRPGPRSLPARLVAQMAAATLPPRRCHPRLPAGSTRPPHTHAVSEHRGGRGWRGGGSSSGSVKRSSKKVTKTKIKRLLFRR